MGLCSQFPLRQRGGKQRTYLLYAARTISTGKVLLPEYSGTRKEFAAVVKDCRLDFSTAQLYHEVEFEGFIVPDTWQKSVGQYSRIHKRETEIVFPASPANVNVFFTKNQIPTTRAQYCYDHRTDT